jgi:hypothetical protein
MSVKISALPAAAAAAGTDQHPVNQGGTTKRLTNAQIATFIQTALTQLSINGGIALINSDGSAQFAGLNINAVGDIDTNGSITINAGQVQLNNDGSAFFANGVTRIDIAGVISVNGLSGITGNFSILVAGVPKTFHFEGGILTSVT